MLHTNKQLCRVDVWVGWVGRLAWMQKMLLFTTLSFTCHGSQTTYRPRGGLLRRQEQKKKLKKTYEEFAGGRTDNWMNVDESIMVS